MANKNPKLENLKPFNKLDREKHREISVKGAEASNKAQADNKTLKNILETMLELDIESFTTNEEALQKLKEINPLYAEKVDVKSVIGARLLQKAIQGDLTAIGFIRDTIGEKPVEKIEQTNRNPKPLRVEIVE